jgi:hypothetical protein
MYKIGFCNGKSINFEGKVLLKNWTDYLQKNVGLSAKLPAKP